MGVKTVLTLNDLPASLGVNTITPSNEGVMDSVYFLDGDRVLKIFETASEEVAYEELKLLKQCETLPVSQPIGEVMTIGGKPAILYRRCPGRSLKTAHTDPIRQIGTFLRNFHTQTQTQHSSNERLFERSRLAWMIEESDMPIFKTLFDRIDPPLRNDGIIHGDLFLDNALFEGESLSCVVDFTQACNGDFVFDLAVVALSWCDSEEKTVALLESYGATLTPEEFRPYCEYATLFYCVNRYRNGGNYHELLEKLI